MGRRMFWATVGLGLMSIGALGGGTWLLGYESAHLPACGALLFLPLLVAGLFLTAAAIVGAPPARPEIDLDHAAALRRLADRVGGTADPFASTLERKMFTAHYGNWCPRAKPCSEQRGCRKVLGCSVG